MLRTYFFKSHTHFFIKITHFFTFFKTWFFCSKLFTFCKNVHFFTFPLTSSLALFRSGPVTLRHFPRAGGCPWSPGPLNWTGIFRICAFMFVKFRSEPYDLKGWEAWPAHLPLGSDRIWVKWTHFCEVSSQITRVSRDFPVPTITIDSIEHSDWCHSMNLNLS